MLATINIHVKERDVQAIRDGDMNMRAKVISPLDDPFISIDILGVSFFVHPPHAIEVAAMLQSVAEQAQLAAILIQPPVDDMLNDRMAAEAEAMAVNQ